MANYLDMLQQAAFGATADKQASVSSAAADKQARLQSNSAGVLPAVGALTGLGQESASPQEMILRTSDPAQISAAMGNTAPNAISSQADALVQATRAGNTFRTDEDRAADAVVDVGMGIANGIGGLAAWGTSLVNKDAGLDMAMGLSKLGEAAQRLQTTALGERRAAGAVRADLRKRDADLITREDSSVVGKLKRVGQGVIDGAVGLADDTALLGSGAAQAAGSVLAAGPLSRVGQAAGVAPKVATPLAIGAMEGGGAFAGTASDILKTPFDKLEANSEDYRALIAEGKTPEEARRGTAWKAAQIAAVIQAPLAAAAGKLVSRFETAPLAVVSPRQAVGNVVRETVEEGIQSGTGAVAQNVGKSVAKNDQDLLEGVGEQIGEGAVLGGLSAGGMSAPSLAGGAVITGGRSIMGAARMVADSAAERTAKLKEKNAKASPVADDKVAAAAASAVQAAPVAAQTMGAAVDASTATPEVKAQVHEYVKQITDAVAFDPEFLNQEGMTPGVVSSLSGSTTRAEAIQRLADSITAAKTPQEALEYATALYMQMEPVNAIRENANEGNVQAALGSPEAIAAMQQFDRVLANMDNTPKVKAAYEFIERKLVPQAAKDLEAAPITEATAAPDVVQKALMVAEVAPEKMPAASARALLKQAENGQLQLTDAQRQSLMVSASIVEAAQAYDAQVDAMGHGRKQDLVGKQIKTDESRSGAGEQSAVQHAKGIASAMRAGNYDLARDRLNDFGAFVDHMQRKVAAVNEHFAAGNPNADAVSYLALMPDRTTRPAKKGVYVNTNSEKSIELAQQMGFETEALTDIFNGLAGAFSELGVSHKDSVSLDPKLLEGTPRALQQAHAKSVVEAAKKKPAPAPVVEKAAPTSEAAPTTDDTTTAEINRDEVQQGEKQAEPEPKGKPEAVPAEAQQQEQAPAAKEPEVVADTNDADTTANTGIGAVYEGLLRLGKSKRNFFVEAFKLPAEAVSRLVGEQSPMLQVYNALATAGTLSKFTGKAITRDFSGDLAKSFRDYVRKTAGGLVTQLDVQLQEKLAEKSGNTTIANILKNGDTDANRWVAGKVFNLLTEDEDGMFYQQELVESASLAGAQWLLTADSMGSHVDAADVAAMTGLDQELAETLVDTFNVGMSSREAVRSLATKIASYWGVVPTSKDLAQGYTDGIPAAMAAEILRAMIAQGLVEVQTTHINDQGLILPADTASKDAYRTINRYIPKGMEQGDVKREFSGAIDHAVLTNPEETFYLDQAMPPVATSQLRNNVVPLTADQKKALEHDQATEYFVDQPMVDVYRALGIDGVLALFGHGAIDADKMNETHFQSQDGKNRSVAAGFDHMETLLAELGAVAGDRDVTEVPVRFPYSFTRVNRMQMLGKHNPQSNKLIREMLLPTWSTLDLSKPGEHMNLYKLGLAQGLGIKVHNMSVEAMSGKLDAMLSSLAPSIEKLRDVLAGGTLSPEQVQEIKANFKAADADLTNVGFHALVDWTRLQMAEDKSAFRTSVYVEADGVTNGPINAMALMTSGLFTEGWVKNIAKGGLFFGTDAKTMNEHRANDDSVDMYEASTHVLAQNLAERRAQFADKPEVAAMMTALESFMELFLKDLTFKDGALQMKRGIAKNPLTITIYGSGARGIAGKLVSNVMDEIYGKMSEMIGNQIANPELSDAQAMFGETADAQAKYDRFWSNLSDLLSKKVVESKKKGWISIDTGMGLPSKFDPKTFKMSGDALKNLTDNMLSLFVGPMVSAINNTVGNGVMDSVGALRDATQAQSLILEDAFKREAAKRMEAKSADPEWRKGDFLSRAELDEALKAVLPLAPFVNLDGKQNYFIAGSQNSPVTESNIASALDGTLTIEASAYGPANAGVAGIPFMTIGSGDGMMMQDLSTMPGAPGDNLKIFDGVNFRLDQLKANSEMANKAVYASWGRNPLQAVADSFKVTMDKLDLEAMTDAGLTALLKGLDPAYVSDMVASGTKRPPESYVKQLLEEKQGLLEGAASDAEMRHRVIDRVAVSVDQMAAAGAPYQNQGKEVVTGTPKEIAARLNELLAEERTATRELTRVRPSKRAAVNSDLDAFASVGKVRKDGIRELSPTALTQLGKAVEMTAEQSELYGEVMRGKRLAGWKVMFGTVEQLNEYAVANGLETLNPGDRGITLPGSQTILLASPTVETLVHELVHADTFEKVLATEHNAATPEIADAVQRIKIMRDQFLNGDLTDAANAIGGDAIRALIDAKNAVLGALRNRDLDKQMRQAVATNEFMAWVLANKDLAKAAGNTTASPLVRLTKAAIAAIKKLVWGKAKSASVPEGDVASNLLFNTMVIMRSQLEVADAVADTALAHNVQYGEDSRLDKINRGFAQALQRLTAMSPTASQPKINNAIKVAVDAGMMVAAQGFTFTEQQLTTFRSMVAAMASQTKLDGNSMAAADALYQHVLKTLEPEHFMADPASQDPAAYYFAKQKYDAVVGNTRAIKDALGRETMMPVFLALSVTNQDMRDALAKLPLMKADKDSSGTLDAYLRNAGEDAMWALGRYVTGTNGEKLSDVVDSLALYAAETAQERDNFLETAATKAGGVIDTVNDMMVEKLQQLSDLAKAGGDKLAQGNLAEKTASSVLRAVSALTSEKNGKAVAEGVMSQANASKMYRPLFDLLNDLAGRTTSNAAVYDLIKLVRSTVQQTRQQFREAVPGIIRDKFSRELTAKEWEQLHTGLGKTDVAVLAQAQGVDHAALMITDPKARAAEISRLEDEAKAIEPRLWNARKAKAQQLADYMMGKKAGARLLRNADAIWDLAGASTKKGNADGIAAIDQLVSLYALNDSAADISLLVQSEREGVDFAVSYLIGQRVEETRKTAQYSMAKYNALKGNLPAEQQPGVSLLIADDDQFAELAEKSYVRVADYVNSDLERGVSRGYYFAPVAAKAAFAQGIMQNVRTTAGGVDVTSGFSTGMTGGRITDSKRVKDLTKWLDRDTGAESLIPVYDENGLVVGLERTVDPVQMARLNQEKNLANAIGQWRGRQVEEVQGAAFNEVLVDRLHAMYMADLAAGKKDEYVNLAASTRDNVVADAVSLLNSAQVEMIEDRFGEDEFWVRKDMLHDAIGYRAASIGDMWTGTSRWSADTQEKVKDIAMAVFGNEAYAKLVNGEKILKNLVADAKTIIVVKSMVVPYANMVSNVYQLISRGVPMMNIVKGVPKKIAEVKAYTDGRAELITLEADLLAARGNPSKELVLKNRIKAIEDGFTRLSIFPLVQAGEFAAISDASQNVEDRMLSEGRLYSYMEALTDRLPEGVKTAGKYAMITKDTALFQGLQKAVDYGDFIAKALIYQDLTERKGLSQEEALGKVTEEFVNYDRLPGRTRGYAESVGLLWFYNFKIRISKIALNTLRNNPLHALIASNIPQPSDVGLPLEDNLFAAMADGRLGYSIGPGMGLRAPSLNPMAALLH